MINRHSNRRKFFGNVGAVGSSLTLANVASGSLTTFSGPPGSKPKRKIKIGQIGVGHAHANKLSVYRQLPDYEIVGIVEADPKLQSRAKNQKPFQDLTWMTQEQLLNVPGLDAVLVETRVRDSLLAAKACIAAGKHIHLDKPAGSSFQELKAIMTSAERQQLLVQMGYMYRYNPAILLLGDFLRRGWLGEVFEVHTVMSKTINASERKALATYPGGMMFELGCHILDLVIKILGQPDQVTGFNRHSSPQQDQLIDNMLTVLEYPKATATVKASAQEVEGFARRHLVVCGNEGTFHIQPLDRPTAKIALAKNRGIYKAGVQQVDFSGYARYVEDARDMARIIRHEKKSDFNYAHDLTVQKSLLTACGLPLE